MRGHHEQENPGSKLGFKKIVPMAQTPENHHGEFMTFMASMHHMKRILEGGYYDSKKLSQMWDRLKREGINAEQVMHFAAKTSEKLMGDKRGAPTLKKFEADLLQEYRKIPTRESKLAANNWRFA